MKKSLHEFHELWRKRATDNQTIVDWGTTDTNKVNKATEAEALSPGSVAKVAIGEHFQSAYMYITSKRGLDLKSRIKFHNRLCKVLIGVCLKGTFKVNPLAVKKTPNNLFYLKLEVHGDLKFVKKVLEGRELAFDIRIPISPNQVIIKHFAINLQSERVGRDYISRIIEVPGADSEFPDYDQWLCCALTPSDRCLSGCVPVAWAEIMGYLDRRASPKSPVYNARFSPSIYAEYGNNNVRAPLVMTLAVEGLVEDIRRQVQTYCSPDKVGLTKGINIHMIDSWFQIRQARAEVVYYLKKYNTPEQLSHFARHWLDLGWPVLIGFHLSGPNSGGHVVVATRYRTQARNIQICPPNGMCYQNTFYKHEFYLHYGWGGQNNQWQAVEMLNVHVAFVKP